MKQVEVRKLPYFKAVHITWGDDETSLKEVKRQLYQALIRRPPIGRKATGT